MHDIYKKKIIYFLWAEKYTTILNIIKEKENIIFKIKHANQRIKSKIELKY